jgi:hypothetical protein
MSGSRYDQVGLRKPGGGYNMITRRAFEAMPLRERVRLIMDDQVQFLNDGKVVPAREALAKSTP